MTEVKVSEARTSFATAKSVQLSCPKCGYLVEAVYPYGSTGEDKMKIRHQVISEHTKVCSVATGEVQRIWLVETPRS
jgi:threonine synthase